MSAFRLFCCDLPWVLYWRNSLPIVHPFFYRTLGHSSNFIYIYFILVTCLFSQSQWKSVRNRSIRDSRKAGSLWGMMRGVGGVRKSIHQSWLAKGLGLGWLCWGFKRVQEEIPSEEASTLQIGSVAFPAGQHTSPQLHLCHRLLDQDGHQDSSSPSLSSRPCSRWLLSLWDNWGDERGCDESHWHAHTRGHRWSLPEVVVTVQKVHYNRRRLLRRGLEFHVCTVNKSAYTKKVWKLI